MKNIYSRPVSFAVCLMVYLLALAASLTFIHFFNAGLNGLWLMLAADILATVVVFGFSVAFRNSSLYDPYWSVAPPLIAWYWLLNGSGNPALYLMLAAILLWSVRLTLNWCRGWQGLAYEDWRYGMLREKNPGLYPLVNFFGIHLFPTLMVFLGLLPVYVMTSSMTGSGINTLFVAGLLITIAAVAIELAADEQLRKFKKRAKKGDYINIGLWKYSRHPNYFGEISFWFGLWVMQMAVSPQQWWTAIGFVAMLNMFLFASIPMMEAKNMKSKTGYNVYVKRVSRLIPMPVNQDKI
jgi:steroid 5-alpha reductase family enzyme